MDDLREFHEINEIDEIDEIHEICPRLYRQRKNPFEIYTDVEFRRKYRFSKTEAKIIIERLKDDITSSQSDKGKPITPELKILAALSGFARNRPQDDTADLHGFSQATMSRINLQVARALAGKLNEYIKFPTTLAEQMKTMNDFKKIRNMPQIIGAIDCTHVRIKKTGGDIAQMYINRKGFYSLNVQVICDANCKITNIVAKWRGSTHDSRIFNESVIKQKFENGDFCGRLVGDGGYASSSYMLTPYLNPANPAQEAYNRAQISTRNVVERLFGQWKQRYRGLLRGLTVSLDTAKTMIVALAVLHNMAIDMRATTGDWTDSESESSDSEEDNPVPAEHFNLAGRVARDVYVAEHFS